MCELLGLAFNKPISPGLSFRGFRHRAARNEGGWGLAAITPTKARITKEPLRADRSELSQNLRDDPQLIAPIFIGHVRRASCGDVNLQNTHPFTRRIKRSDFVFAHNGTLDMSLLKCRVADPFHVDGSTDSELAMCVLLSWMAREKVDHQNYALFEEFLKDLNAIGQLNLLFSDGNRLYCYHDADGYNGLCWTHRQAPFSRVSLLDEDWEADLGEQKALDQKGFIIASQKLTDGEDWQAFRAGSLMVFERGKVVYETIS
ncbi:MAG: class II glutamine amidotransferase [Planctomycetota bacterium]